MDTKIRILLNEIAKVNVFLNEVTKFDSDIDIISGRYICDAKSIMGIFSHNLSKPVEVEIHTNNSAELTKFNFVMEQFK